MKLVHVSDIHITGSAILGADPVANFRACLAHIEAHHGDAERVVVTGDLTHWGLPQEWAMLRDLLATTELPVRLLLGNHDNRDTFQAAFPQTPRDPNGFVQYAEDVSAGRFIYLDTVEADTHAGHYCEARQDWLAGELARARQDGRDAFVFLHHNPLPIGISASDGIGLVEHGPAFRALLAANRDVVRHVFFGHCHYVLSGSVAGIPFSSPRSTNHPCLPDFQGRDEIAMAPLPPTYNVVLINDGNTVVHSIDFNFDGPVTWVGTTVEDWAADAAD